MGKKYEVNNLDYEHADWAVDDIPYPYYRVDTIEYMHSAISTWVTFEGEYYKRQYTNPRFTSIRRLERLMNDMVITVKMDEYMPIITAADQAS